MVQKRGAFKGQQPISCQSGASQKLPRAMMSCQFTWPFAFWSRWHITKRIWVNQRRVWVLSMYFVSFTNSGSPILSYLSSWALRLSFGVLIISLRRERERWEGKTTEDRKTLWAHVLHHNGKVLPLTLSFSVYFLLLNVDFPSSYLPPTYLPSVLPGPLLLLSLCLFVSFLSTWLISFPVSPFLILFHF